MIRAMLVFSILWIGALGVSAETFELTPKKIKITKKNADIFPELELRVQDVLTGVNSEPNYKSKAPQKFITSFGGEDGVEVAFAVDESKAGKGYTSLYADVTGKGDLKKAKRVSGKPVLRGSFYEDTTFKPFEVEIPISEDAEPYPVQARIAVRFSNPGSHYPDDSTLYLTSLSAMEGEVVFGETTQQMVLFDANCNGVFGEKTSATGHGLGARGDKIWVGDKLGSIDDAYVGAIPIGKYFLHGGKYYELTFPTSTQVQIAETEVPLGRVRIPSEGYILELVDGNDLLVITDQGTEEIDVPVGHYAVRSPHFRRKGKGGIWELEGKPGACDAKFDVSEGNVTEFMIGPPLKVQITATPRSGSGGYYVSLSFKLEGAEGEEYQYLRKDGKKVKLPEVSIRNDRGREVKKGHFEYG